MFSKLNGRERWKEEGEGGGGGLQRCLRCEIDGSFEKENGRSLNCVKIPLHGSSTRSRCYFGSKSNVTSVSKRRELSFFFFRRFPSSIVSTKKFVNGVNVVGYTLSYLR